MSGFFCTETPFFAYWLCMDIKKTLGKSGLRNINLVSPTPRCSEGMKRDILYYTKKYNIEQSAEPRSDKGWLDLVVYDRVDEAYVTDYCLLRRVIGPWSAQVQSVSKLYEYLRDETPKEVRVKQLMKTYRLGSFYKAREIVLALCHSGLFFPVKRESRLFLVPYYYHGKDREVLVLRHLMGLGYAVSFNGPLIYAAVGRLALSVGFSLEDLNRYANTARRILIDEKVEVNFSNVHTMKLDAFLRCDEF